MCRSTAPSVWNAVEIEMLGEKRSIAHSITASGSSPSNSTLSSPASRSSSSSTDTGSLPSCETSELVVGCAVAERPERLSVGARLDPAADEADDGVVELLGGHALEHRAADRGRAVEAAAHVHVVRLAPATFFVADGRALEADLADPVMGARVRAAVEVHAQAVGCLPEAVFEQLHELVHASLRLGDGEVAVRLAGAGDGVAAQRAGV